MIQQANPGGAIAVYDNIGDPMSTMKTFGLTVASSGMFGSLTPAQGEILAMECMVQRLPPMQLALRYHIIGNKLSMKADAMLAEFIEQGGKHKVVCRTPDKAEVQLAYQGETQNFSITADEVKQEPYYYNGKQSEILKALAKGGADLAKLELNPNYATPRKRMQMLWSRVVSDGVRTMMPGVNFGRYTPEELGDGGEGEEVEAESKPAKRNGKAKQPTIDEVVAGAGAATVAERAAPSESATQGEVVDAEYEVVPDAATDDKALLLSVLDKHLTAAGVAAREELCKKFGVGAIVGLSIEQLNAAIDEYTTEEETAALTAPCSQVQIEQFKKILAALVVTHNDIGGRIQAELAKLVAKGEIKEPRASQLTTHAMSVLLYDMGKGDTNLTQFKMKVSEAPF